MHIINGVFTHVQLTNCSSYSSITDTNVKMSDKLKVTKVVSIYEQGHTDDIANYQPMTGLSSVSKCFERFMCNSVMVSSTNIAFHLILSKVFTKVFLLN